MYCSKNNKRRYSVNFEKSIDKRYSDGDYNSSKKKRVFVNADRISRNTYKQMLHKEFY